MELSRCCQRFSPPPCSLQRCVPAEAKPHACPRKEAETGIGQNQALTYSGGPGLRFCLIQMDWDGEIWDGWHSLPLTLSWTLHICSSAFNCTALVPSFAWSLVFGSVPIMANRRMRFFDILDLSKLLTDCQWWCDSTSAAGAVDRTFLHLITSAKQLASAEPWWRWTNTHWIWIATKSPPTASQANPHIPIKGDECIMDPTNISVILLFW